MRFKVEKLQEKNVEEIRQLFSSVSRSTDYIELEGKFNLGFYQINFIPEILIYLPRHINRVVFNIEYCHEYTKPTPSGIESTVSYPDYYYYRESIGNSLKYYIGSLPQWITSVNLNFNAFDDYPDTTVCEDMKELVKHCPPHISTLSLGNAVLYNKGNSVYALLKAQLAKLYEGMNVRRGIFENIPSTVTTLGVGLLKLGRLPSAERKSILSAIRPELIHLSLKDNHLDQLDNQSLSDFPSELPSNLMLLDLGYNNLYLAENKLALFLSTLSSLQALKVLVLRGNQLFGVSPENLAAALSKLPDTLEALDLGKNCLLGLSPDSFGTIMGGLPKTLKRLSLCEEGSAFSKEQLKANFPLIPAFIEKVNLGGGNLLGFSVADFIDVIAYFPNTVKTLGLNGDNLSTRTVKELVFLFSNLPPHLTGLTLTYNFLARFDPAELKRILAALPPFITELDVSDNGLDRLPYSQMQKVLHSFPLTIKKIVTGSEEFGIRNDGALVPYQGLSEMGVFNAQKYQKRFHHYAKFGPLRLVIMQVTMQLEQLISRDLVLFILSYVFETPYPVVKQLEPFFMTTPIASRPPKKITPTHESECLMAVAQRIGNVRPKDTCLDLSRCGLNRLESDESQVSFKTTLKTLPEEISTLKLRGNGFLCDDRCQNVFTALMEVLPDTITYLDLSANDFEHQYPEKLTHLFARLPLTVKWVTLDHEQPIAPAEQIAKRCWPESYLELTKNLSNEIEQARSLLDDYTKGDSVLWRIVYFHWNRSHTVEMARLVYYIDRGLITCAEDLQYEIEQIKFTNEKGSSSRRYSFLKYHPKPVIEELPSENLPLLGSTHK